MFDVFVIFCRNDFPIAHFPTSKRHSTPQVRPTEPELPVPSCRELPRLPLSWRPRLEEETPRVDASQLSAPHVFQTFSNDMKEFERI